MSDDSSPRTDSSPLTPATRDRLRVLAETSRRSNDYWYSEQEAAQEHLPVEDARFLAALTPEVVLALLRELDDVKRERLTLAKLASETPQFFNPLEAWAAKDLRDRLLGGTNAN